MRRLLLDTVVALAMVGWHVLRGLLDCERFDPRPPPARQDIPEPLAVAEENVEVWEPETWEPEHEWRQRWDALRP